MGALVDVCRYILSKLSSHHHGSGSQLLRRVKPFSPLFAPDLLLKLNFQAKIVRNRLGLNTLWQCIHNLGKPNLCNSLSTFRLGLPQPLQLVSHISCIRYCSPIYVWFILIPIYEGECVRSFNMNDLENNAWLHRSCQPSSKTIQAGRWLPREWIVWCGLDAK